MDAFGVDRDEVSKAKLVRVPGTWRPATKTAQKTQEAVSTSLSRAFGGINQQGQRTAQAATAQRGQQAMGDAFSQINRQMTPPKPVAPTQQAVDAGNQAVMDARRAVQSRANTRRKAKIVAGTGAAVVGSGGAVLGADAIHDRRKKVAKRDDRKTTVMGVGGTAAGAAAGGGALAMGRTVFNSQNRPSKTAVNYGKVPIAIDSKGTATLPKAQTSLERAVWSGHNLGSARSTSDKVAGAVFRPGMGRIGRLGTKGKVALVAAPAVAMGGVAAGASKKRKSRG